LFDARRIRTSDSEEISSSWTLGEIWSSQVGTF